MKITIVMLMLASLGFSQEAKVIQLSPDDAKLAETTYNTMKRVEADWEAMRKSIEHRYVDEAKQEADLSGSATGILYSGDITIQKPSFKCAAKDSYIVAKEDGSFGPSSMDQDCLKKEEKVEAERQLEIAKAKQEQEHPKMHTVYSPKPGWENGFDFSEGFKFVVPKLSIPATPLSTCIYSNGGRWCTNGDATQPLQLEVQ